MSNLQNRNPNNREVPPDGNSNNVGRNVAYQDGYVHGRASERRLRNDSLEVRDNNNAARGLLVGVALTSLVGLTLAALFLLNRRQEEPAPARVIVPAPRATQSPQANQSPQPQTTVIQRTIERVPQIIATPASPGATTQSTTTSPGTTTQTVPRVNVTVPPQPAPRVTVTVPPQTAPRVNVTVPPQPTVTSSPNTTINVVPSQPQSGANTNTNNFGASGANTDTTGTTQRSATSGSGTVNVTPNTTGTTGTTGTNNTTGNTGNNPNNTGTTSRISTQ